MLHHVSVQTSIRQELIDITPLVQKVLQGGLNGICLVYSPHTTAGITIQENADPDVRRDIVTHLTKLVPEHADFRHVEGNSDAHLKTALVGASQMVPVVEGRLSLGRWQSVFFCEFDGPRKRKVLVKFLGG